MKQIIPYQDIHEAIVQLDNGGRFYNIFSKADDGEINSAELERVAGFFSEQQQLVLFLELSISKLAKEDQLQIISKLDSKMRKAFLKHKAQELMASEAEENGRLGANAIVTGVPVQKDSKTEFKGLILIPISSGKATTLIPVPIVDRYDIYEIRDDHAAETFLVAHNRGDVKLPAEQIKVAGVLKSIEMEVEGTKTERKYLEVNYYQSVI